MYRAIFTRLYSVIFTSVWRLDKDNKDEQYHRISIWPKGGKIIWTMRTNWDALPREVVGSCLQEILAILFDKYLCNLKYGPDSNRRLNQMNSRCPFSPRLFCDSLTQKKKTKKQTPKPKQSQNQTNQLKNVCALNVWLYKQFQHHSKQLSCAHTHMLELNSLLILWGYSQIKCIILGVLKCNLCEADIKASEKLTQAIYQLGW